MRALCVAIIGGEVCRIVEEADIHLDPDECHEFRYGECRRDHHVFVELKERPGEDHRPRNVRCEATP